MKLPPVESEPGWRKGDKVFVGLVDRARFHLADRPFLPPKYVLTAARAGAAATQADAAAALPPGAEWADADADDDNTRQQALWLALKYAEDRAKDPAEGPAI